MILTGASRVAGIIGWPVSHSLSPRLHGYWLQEYGVDGAYVPLPVAPQNLEQALKSLPTLGFQGVNVTVPHKQAVLPLMTEVSDIALRIGAVNTVFVSEDGALKGTNTDATGFMVNLRLNAPQWTPSQTPAVVLGAGGAARAIVAALIDAKVPEVRLINRTRDKADLLAKALGGPIKTFDWADRVPALADAGLVVNTTTLGMVKQPPLDLDLTPLPDSAVVNDLVYAPLETPLLKAARDRGLNTVDGLGMLLHQAVPGFEGWFGIRPKVGSDLRQFVLGGT